jgi:Gluconate 2-dehydrogenase subunit 3
VNRRDAIRLTVLGGALVACARETAHGDDDALMTSIADTLLPTTASSPGARAAGVGPVMHVLLMDCYDAAAQKRMAEGLVDFRARFPTFVSRPQPERERMLRELEAEAKRTGEAHWFHLARELSERAYFSSEIGMTRALRYVRIPGKWVGCTPLAPGQPAWG